MMRASAANHGFRVLSTLLRYDSGLCLWHLLCTMLLSPIFRLATCLVESESDSECGPGILQCKLKVAYQETHVLRYSKVERRSGSAIHLDLKKKKNTPGCRSSDSQRGIKQSIRKCGKAYRKLTTSAKVCEFNFSRTMQIANRCNQINYDTSQLYHGFLMGMGCTILGLLMSFLGLRPRKYIINPQMVSTIPIPIKKPWYNYNMRHDTTAYR